MFAFQRIIGAQLLFCTYGCRMEQTQTRRVQTPRFFGSDQLFHVCLNETWWRVVEPLTAAAAPDIFGPPANELGPR